MAILKKDLQFWIKNGGSVTFDWRSGRVTVSAEGRELLLDGRTYSGFLQSIAPSMKRSETGSTEAKDLVITWS